MMAHVENIRVRFPEGPDGFHLRMMELLNDPTVSEIQVIGPELVASNPSGNAGTERYTIYYRRAGQEG